MDIGEPIPHGHVTMPGGRYVMLAVSDTGTGMDAGTQSRIFEPFFTTKEEGKGTGLGLATVHGIVKQSNGYICVYSEPGRGTTFKIYLPRTEPGAKTAAEVPKPELLRGSETILLAEDEESLRRLTRQVLENSGYRVVTAASGEEAERLAESYEGPIHLLLSDVVMRGLSGRELVERLVPRHPGMKVLYMSGYTNDAVLHHGIAAEDVNFIQKPFTPRALAGKVREVLDGG